MTPSDVSSLTAQLLWAVFLLAAVYGAIGQRTHFCTMGAISDVVNLGDWTRMRMWAAAIAVTLITFNALVALGLADAGRTIYGGPRLLWASTLVGGALFGFGMVLASGCGSRTLVRIGSGNLKSLVVLLVMGLAAWITLKGLTAVWRVNTLDKLVWQLPAGQDLPSLLAHAGGLARGTWAAGLAAVLGGGLLIWALADAEARKAGPLLGGLGSGVVVAGGWWLSGVYGYLPEHPETLEPTFLATASRSMENFSFVGPVAQLLEFLTFYSDASRHLSLGAALVLGVPVGAAASALAGGTFRWESFRDAADLGRHLAGAVLMGVGGVTALGCTIGQGVSGISTLSLGSAIALAGIVAGALGGFRFLNWQLERSA